MAMHELESGNIANPDVTPSHPFTPDVVAWAETKIRNYESLLAGGWIFSESPAQKAARQILAAMGREEPRFVRVPQSGRRVKTPPAH